MATTILIRRRYFYPCLKQAPSSTKCQHTSRHCCTLSNELSFFLMAWQQGPSSLDLRGGWGLNGKSLRLFLLSDPRCWRSTTTSTRLAPERRSVAAATCPTGAPTAACRESFQRRLTDGVVSCRWQLATGAFLPVPWQLVSFCFLQ
jgi:hypothetical protein